MLISFYDMLKQLTSENVIRLYVIVDSVQHDFLSLLETFEDFC